MRQSFAIQKSSPGNTTQAKKLLTSERETDKNLEKKNKAKWGITEENTSADTFTCSNEKPEQKTAQVGNTQTVREAEPLSVPSSLKSPPSPRVHNKFRYQVSKKLVSSPLSHSAFGSAATWFSLSTLSALATLPVSIWAAAAGIAMGSLQSARNKSKRLESFLSAPASSLKTPASVSAGDRILSPEVSGTCLGSLLGAGTFLLGAPAAGATLVAMGGLLGWDAFLKWVARLGHKDVDLSLPTTARANTSEKNPLSSSNSKPNQSLFSSITKRPRLVGSIGAVSTFLGTFAFPIFSGSLLGAKVGISLISGAVSWLGSHLSLENEPIRKLASAAKAGATAMATVTATALLTGSTLGAAVIVGGAAAAIASIVALAWKCLSNSNKIIFVLLIIIGLLCWFAFPGQIAGLLEKVSKAKEAAEKAIKSSAKRVREYFPEQSHPTSGIDEAKA